MELYVHIPFCVRKCSYCDFLSFPEFGCDADERHHSLSLSYVDALCREINENLGQFYTTEEAGKPCIGSKITSVFVGGGTPSVLGLEETEKLLKCLRTFITKETEFTIECNPGTLDKEKLLLYKEFGVNRLSIGLQSADNKILENLGRIHTFEEFLDNYKLARSIGFTNINIDLISAVPGQNMDNWRETLEKVTDLNPEHISAYSLIIEEGTPLYEKYIRNPGSLQLPDEETEREIYHYTKEYLKEKGYERYEISNYAKKGYECRHNLGYWTGEEYIGAGLGAASYLSVEKARKTMLNYEIDYCNKRLPNDMHDMHMCRIKNTDELDKYISAFSREKRCAMPQCSVEEKTERMSVYYVEEKLNLDEMMKEFCILGLRLTEGISSSDFKKRFNIDLLKKFGDIINKHIQDGLLEESGDMIRFTEKGLDLSNIVLCDFI